MSRRDMKTHTIAVLTAMILLLVVTSCSDDSGSGIMGPVEDVSFVNDIQPIFNGSCGGAGCHVEATQSGVNLTSYDHVMSSVGQQYGRAIVEPGSPDESPLVDKIEPNPEHGQRMPFGGDPLSNQQIEQIRVWIEEGAMDN